MRVFLIVVAAVALIAAAVTLTQSNESSVAVEPISRTNRLKQNVDSLQARLNRVPGDASGWAQLGSSYVELARTTTDPNYYAKAQGALDRSVKLMPEGNGEAMTGMGALANARHDFAEAKDWATRAQALMPETAEVYGVLADALTQLGDDKGSMDAVQRMLDLKPNVAAFTRAAYYFELHGQQAEARSAMRRGLDSATSSDEAAFCEYQLGELAWNIGQVEQAHALRAGSGDHAERSGFATWSRQGSCGARPCGRGNQRLSGADRTGATVHSGLRQAAVPDWPEGRGGPAVRHLGQAAEAPGVPGRER
ncbi:hypothetical protein LWC34_07915 [Kibdelosporangium philippinense]|uniref:Tetratricopeptide repeat protein n=1 Tax=Kibdelosporangium philippinense TaxID=211113 RepID=A0ABS8Z7I7_9PSEU|nr:hypothetical protein [Kibdelosporangium philippinense]MCE7002755.1 hypothetical protein [Kibdelosporangium philippinense]